MLYLEVAECGDLGIDLCSGECGSMEVGGVCGLVDRSMVETVELELLAGREIVVTVSFKRDLPRLAGIAREPSCLTSTRDDEGEDEVWVL